MVALAYIIFPLSVIVCNYFYNRFCFSVHETVSNQGTKHVKIPTGFCPVPIMQAFIRLLEAFPTSFLGLLSRFSTCSVISFLGSCKWCLVGFFF